MNHQPTEEELALAKELGIDKVLDDTLVQAREAGRAGIDGDDEYDDEDDELDLHYREPPPVINGLEYEMVEEGFICMGGCCQIISVGEWTIKRNRRGMSFRNYLPANQGICLGCAADKLSQYSLVAYDKVLNAIEIYETLKENEDPTEAEAEEAFIQEEVVKSLNTFIDELGKFVQNAEDSPPEYVDVGTIAETASCTDSEDGGECEEALSEDPGRMEGEQSEHGDESDTN